MSQVIDIDIIFRDTFLTVLQLRSGVTTSDGLKLYQNAKYQVEAVQKTLRDANFSKDDIDLITYAQCALLDETVMNRHLENQHDAAYQTWIGLPLQIHFFNSLEAGDKIFDNIKEIMNTGRPNPIVLTSYHRILLLGFCGKYGKNIDHPERVDVLQKLTVLINELNAYPMQVEHNSALLGQPKKSFWRPSRRFLTWSLVCCSTIGVAALWNFYDFSLNQQINKTIPNAPDIQNVEMLILNTPEESSTPVETQDSKPEINGLNDNNNITINDEEKEQPKEPIKDPLNLNLNTLDGNNLSDKIITPVGENSTNPPFNELPDPQVFNTEGHFDKLIDRKHLFSLKSSIQIVANRMPIQMTSSIEDV